MALITHHGMMIIPFHFCFLREAKIKILSALDESLHPGFVLGLGRGMRELKERKFMASIVPRGADALGEKIGASK